MKVKLVLARTLCDPLTAWQDIKIVEVEIPLQKQNPDGGGCYQVLGCDWPEEEPNERPTHA